MEEITVVSKQNEKKQKKLKSKVWDDFTKFEPGEDGKRWAICNHCGGKFDGSSKKGTTHLKNHLVSKICRDKRKRDDDDDDENGDKSTKTRDKSAAPVVMEEKSYVIDLIKHRFKKDLFWNSNWDPSIINSKKDEILKLYQQEKEKLGEFLHKLSCRFSLCIDNVNPGIHYSFPLIVQYIDDSWERKIKIISILPGDENWIEETKELCSELKIDRNICCIILSEWLMEVDDGSGDAAAEVTDSWFSQRGSLPFAGFVLDFEGFRLKIQHFVFAYAREIIETDGLRECVDYVYKTSTSNKLMLQLAINNAVTKGKKVIFDDDLPSISLSKPFECLEVAVGLREAFSELQKIDPHFISINLTNQIWDEATATFQHLKAWRRELYKSFHWDNCTTTTKVVDILKLYRFHISEDCHLCKDASYKKLFDKIQIYLVVAILDPRFKMETVQLWYKEIYGSDADGYFEKTIKYFRDIYNDYAKDSSSDYKMMDAMGRPSTSSPKSELDLYLNDLKIPIVQEFDILAWWRGNTLFYPTLARMARDYLAVPIQPIDINLTLRNEIDCIGGDFEIDDDVKSALIYLRGLSYD